MTTRLRGSHRELNSNKIKVRLLLEHHSVGTNNILTILFYTDECIQSKISYQQMQNKHIKCLCFHLECCIANPSTEVPIQADCVWQMSPQGADIQPSVQGVVSAEAK